MHRQGVQYPCTGLTLPQAIYILYYVRRAVHIQPCVHSKKICIVYDEVKQYTSRGCQNFDQKYLVRHPHSTEVTASKDIGRE